MRVMILEDDHWIADLLKQIVLRLRPHAAIVCLSNAVMLMCLGRRPPPTATLRRACGASPG